MSYFWRVFAIYLFGVGLIITVAISAIVLISLYFYATLSKKYADKTQKKPADEQGDLEKAKSAEGTVEARLNGGKAAESTEERSEEIHLEESNPMLEATSALLNTARVS